MHTTTSTISTECKLVGAKLSQFFNRDGAVGLLLDGEQGFIQAFSFHHELHVLLPLQLHDFVSVLLECLGANEVALMLFQKKSTAAPLSRLPFFRTKAAGTAPIRKSIKPS